MLNRYHLRQPTEINWLLIARMAERSGDGSVCMAQTTPNPSIALNTSQEMLTNISYWKMVKAYASSDANITTDTSRTAAAWAAVQVVTTTTTTTITSNVYTRIILSIHTASRNTQHTHTYSSLSWWSEIRFISYTTSSIHSHVPWIGGSAALFTLSAQSCSSRVSGKSALHALIYHFYLAANVSTLCSLHHPWALFCAFTLSSVWARFVHLQNGERENEREKMTMRLRAFQNTIGFSFCHRFSVTHLFVFIMLHPSTSFRWALPSIGCETLNFPSQILYDFCFCTNRNVKWIQTIFTI